MRLVILRPVASIWGGSGPGSRANVSLPCRRALTHRSVKKWFKKKKQPGIALSASKDLKRQERRCWPSGDQKSGRPPSARGSRVLPCPPRSCPGEGVCHRRCQSCSATDLCWWEGGTHSAPPTLSVPCICVSLIVWTLTFSPVHLFQAELCFKSPFPSSAHSAARPTDEAVLWLRHGAGVMRLRLWSSWRGLASPCTGTHTAAPPPPLLPPRLRPVLSILDEITSEWKCMSTF